MPNNPAIPDRFRAVTCDKIGFALMPLMDYQIHFIAEFDGKLDEERLARAMRLLMDAEPVLGSRFVNHWRSPWWQRDEGLATEDFFSVVEGGPGDVEDFISEQMDFFSAPQVKARLVRSGGQYGQYEQRHLVH